MMMVQMDSKDVSRLHICGGGCGTYGDEEHNDASNGSDDGTEDTKTEEDDGDGEL